MVTNTHNLEFMADISTGILIAKSKYTLTTCNCTVKIEKHYQKANPKSRRVISDKENSTMKMSQTIDNQTWLTPVFL